MKNDVKKDNISTTQSRLDGTVCPEKIRKTCCRVALIATSYQVISLGIGALDYSSLQVRQHEGKTLIDTVISEIAPSGATPVYGWCLCAHLGQRGPGSGSGCTCTSCMVCMGCTSCTVNTGCAGCTGCTGYTTDQQQQDEALRKRQEEEQQRKSLDEQKKETERRQKQEFEEGKRRALEQFKGANSGEFDLKGFDANDLGLKGMGVSGSPKSKDVNQDASVVDLRDKKQPYTLDSSVVRGGTPQLRKEVQGDFKNVVSQRENVGENAQVQAILDSFKSGEPSVPTKNLKDLAPGDVILVAPDSLLVKGSDETGIHFVNFLESNGINLLDRFGSNNWSSPASHAAIFIGSRDGKRWYLDNTSKGPVIKNEATFLREYGHRQMDVATLVGQPLSQHEGQELWKGAYELQNTTSYGIKMLKFNGDDAMVCSESSRWLLLRAGRRVNESQSTDVNLGITSLNKKEFVKFSPADFYDQQQYFIIHQLYLK